MMQWTGLSPSLSYTAALSLVYLLSFLSFLPLCCPLSVAMLTAPPPAKRECKTLEEHRNPWIIIIQDVQLPPRLGSQTSSSPKVTISSSILQKS